MATQWDSADWPCMLVETVLGHPLATTGELICNMSRTDGWGEVVVRGSTHPVPASPSWLCNISQSSVVFSSTWRMPIIN